MRLVSFARQGIAGFGVLLDDDVVADLTGALPGVHGLRDLLEQGRVAEAGEVARRSSVRLALDELRLLPVIPNPSKVICVGINYVAHAAEAGRTVGDHPVIFQRYAESLIGHGQPLLRPQVSEQFDFEGEIAVVIGKGGDHIAPEDALDHVAGYTLFNDASVRDWQFHTHQYGMGKNFRSSGALGPSLVTADEVPDPRELSLQTFVNGEKMQEGCLDQLAFDIPTIISYVSQALSWRPGDVIATGTPSGIGFKRTPPVFLRDGDVVEVQAPGLGTLSNPVEDERAVPPRRLPRHRPRQVGGVLLRHARVRAQRRRRRLVRQPDRLSDADGG
jgi:2-keto-4-pentenoate hydratase/2-oxohepta-3-ene-1,7-dioic acid hydratase in catechol pathway